MSGNRRLLATSAILLTLLAMVSAASAQPGNSAGQQKVDVIVKFESHAAKNPAVIRRNGGKVTGGSM